MRHIRGFLNRRTGRSMMLGEVNLAHAQQLAFFGGDAANELQMQFDFIGMQATYLALAREDAAPAGRRPSRSAHPSTRPASGRPSCATTTS